MAKLKLMIYIYTSLGVEQESGDLMIPVVLSLPREVSIAVDCISREGMEVELTETDTLWGRCWSDLPGVEVGGEEREALSFRTRVAERGVNPSFRLFC